MIGGVICFRTGATWTIDQEWLDERSGMLMHPRKSQWKPPVFNRK